MSNDFPAASVETLSNAEAAAIVLGIDSPNVWAWKIKCNKNHLMADFHLFVSVEKKKNLRDRQLLTWKRFELYLPLCHHVVKHFTV